MMTATRPQGLLAILAVLTALGAGCADGDGSASTSGPTTPDPPDAPGPLEIAVRHRNDGAPAAGVKIAVLTSANRLAAPPARSDSTGLSRFAIGEIGDAGGWLYVMAFTGDSLFVHELPPPLAWPPPASRRRDQPSAESVPPSAVVLVGTLIQTGELPRITGTVVAAGTGEPLAGAFVSLSPYLTGYLGRTNTSDDITLADGIFRVSDVPFAVDPISGNIWQVLPLLVTCADYLPAAWLHQPRPGDLNIDITDVVITLAPAGAGTAVLTGVVRFGGAPVADLPVGLGSPGAPAGKENGGGDDESNHGDNGDHIDKAAAGWPGRVTRTCPDGRFTFAALPAGAYVVQPAYLPDDGWLFPNQPANRAWTVAAGATVETDTMQVLRTIVPLTPLGTVTSVPDRFAWEMVPEADGYALYLDNVLIAETAAPEAIGLDLAGLAPGWHVWSVRASTGAGELVGASEVFARFRWQPPPAGR
ncbi:MAG: hypothetical protein RBT60_08295 [Candidatus Krumholzibacteria bacterium]|jgi:hypothetical protein|nr:hypothetical protein [Candidatus Krumholzibacteria bacterium]